MSGAPHRSGDRADDRAVLAALLQQAGEAGARAALSDLGLSDASARDDIHELRQLLAAWRDAKRSARSAAIDWLVRGMLAALLIGIALRVGFSELLK